MIKVFKKTILFILLMNVNAVFTEGEIGVASAVNKNTTDLTLAEERKLIQAGYKICLLYTSPSPRDRTRSRMPSSA